MLRSVWTGAAVEHLENAPSMRLPFRQPVRLVSCIAAALGSLASPAFATDWLVTTCADHGPGSLRDAILNKAQDGDTVDLTGLPGQALCSSISLTTGAITIAQPTLTVLGPDTRVTITGKYHNSVETARIFNHAPASSGTLYLENLDIEYGASVNERGGCIYSSRNVNLSNSRVLHCGSDSSSGQARGGAIYTAGDLTVSDSIIAFNSMGTSQSAAAYGGAAFVSGNLTMTDSIVQGNRTYGVGSKGGALMCAGSVTITGSTVSGNLSSAEVGGLSIFGIHAGVQLTVVNSTISGNVAEDGAVGGIETPIATTLRNSTIAFNVATSGDVHRAAGLAVDYAFGLTPPTITLENTVLSNNCSASDCSVPADFGIQTTGLADPVNVPIVGSKNLVYAASPALPLPVATAGVCPLLGPLRQNGGPTPTHALQSHSPAIDAGDNLASQSLAYDQRGTPFARRAGPSGDPTPQVDIGAYEVDQADIVFAAGFDGCP